jgi:hypothetical protein
MMERINHNRGTLNRTCRECGEKLIGRKDKKFCSDYCRTNYHNRIYQDAGRIRRKVHRILRNNQRILSELKTNGKSKVHRRQLVERGYKFGYLTNLFETQSGKKYKFCYDQGLLEQADGYYTLVVKQDYVD